MSKQLPPNPRLDSLKKQARQLLNGFKAEEPEVLDRIEQVLPDLPDSAREEFGLRHAQQVIAREYGFSSWQKLAEHVGRPSEEPEDTIYRKHLERMAEFLIGFQNKGHNPHVLQRIQQVLPQYVGRAAEEVSAALSLSEARLVVAREYQYESWEVFEAAAGQKKHKAINADQMSGLELLHESFISALAVNFTNAEGVDQRVDVNKAFIDQTSYGEFIYSLANHTCSFSMDVYGMEGKVILDLASPVLQGLVKVSPRPQGDAYAEDEITRMQYLGERIARDFEKTWAPVKKVVVRSVQLHTDPYELRVVPMPEIIGLLGFSVDGRSPDVGFGGLMSLCYPMPTLAALLPALGELSKESAS